MNVFKNYALYYDLLYKDKNYELEVDYINNLILKYISTARTILEFGSGTGQHAVLLAKKYNIHGVDISEEMVARAEERKNKQKELSNKLDFSCGDIRLVRLDRKFDVVLSLFHVVSYQVTNGDLNNTFQTANEHLNEDGYFIFDCWYGPSVLTNQPSVRVKRLEDRHINLTRIAEPKMDSNENLVDVKYQIYIQDKRNKKIEELNEIHKMRYFFKPELEMFAFKNGFELVGFEEWLTGNLPGMETWGVCFICKKNNKK